MFCQNENVIRGFSQTNVPPQLAESVCFDCAQGVRAGRVSPVGFLQPFWERSVLRSRGTPLSSARHSPPLRCLLNGPDGVVAAVCRTRR